MTKTNVQFCFFLMFLFCLTSFAKVYSGPNSISWGFPYETKLRPGEIFEFTVSFTGITDKEIKSVEKIRTVNFDAIWKDFEKKGSLEDLKEIERSISNELASISPLIRCDRCKTEVTVRRYSPLNQTFYSFLDFLQGILLFAVIAFFAFVDYRVKMIRFETRIKRKVLFAILSIACWAISPSFGFSFSPIVLSLFSEKRFDTISFHSLLLGDVPRVYAIYSLLWIVTFNLFVFYFIMEICFKKNMKQFSASDLSWFYFSSIFYSYLPCLFFYFVAAIFGHSIVMLILYAS